MTSRSDSGVAGWGLTKTELRTAGGQGKWDRAVETRERGACLPHLSPHEHQGVAPPGPGRSRDMCDPNSVSPLTAGPGWCEGWQTACSRAHSVITDSWFLPPFLCSQVTLLLLPLKSNSKPLLLQPPGPSLPQTKPTAREGRHQRGHRGKGLLL